jgi:hypothetical protein
VRLLFPLATSIRIKRISDSDVTFLKLFLPLMHLTDDRGEKRREDGNMKYKPDRQQRNDQRKSAVIRTTIMELLRTLSDLTRDDRIVLAAFKSIFDSYNVRFAHRVVPIRLIVPPLESTKRKFVH